MTITLKQLNDEIYNLISNAKSSNIHHVTIIVNVYQKNEYDMTKHILNQIDILITTLILKQLRIMKQNIRRKNNSNLVNIKRNRDDKQSQRDRLKDNNLVNVECFKCDKKDYYKSNYFNFKKKGEKANKNDISRSKNKRKTFNKFTTYSLKRKNKIVFATKKEKNNDIKKYLAKNMFE